MRITKIEDIQGRVIMKVEKRNEEGEDFIKLVFAGGDFIELKSFEYEKMNNAGIEVVEK